MAASLVACGEGGEGEGDVVVVEAKRGDVVFESSFYGELEAAEARAIFAPELRNIWQITVETVLADGTEVKKGDTVMTFTRGSIEADLRDRETELRVAEANHKKVLADYEDQRIARGLDVQRSQLAVELAKMNVVEGVNLISKIDLEKAKVELTRAELQLELDNKELVVLEKKRTAALDAELIQVTTAKQKVEETKAQLAKTTITAPADGVLFAPYTRLNWVMSKVAPGRVVRPGDKVLEIPSLDRFKAAVYVRQREASNIKVGDSAVVVPTMFPDVRLKAKVASRDEFATTRNERTGASSPGGTLKELRVVLDIEPPAEGEPALVQLRPGGTVRADIATTLAKDVVHVPLSALREVPNNGQGGHVVITPDGVERPVTVGQMSLTHAEITKGLSAGDPIRLDGAQKKKQPEQQEKKQK